MFSQASVILSMGGEMYTPDQTPPGQTPAPPPGQTLPQADTPPPLLETVTAEDGTHPSGMYSCFLFKIVFVQADGRPCKRFPAFAFHIFRNYGCQIVPPLAPPPKFANLMTRPLNSYTVYTTDSTRRIEINLTD